MLKYQSLAHLSKQVAQDAWRKEVISVKVVIKIIINQLFKNPGNKRKYSNRSILRSIVSLNTFENGGNSSNFLATWEYTSCNRKIKYLTK